METPPIDTLQISTDQCVDSITNLLDKYRNDPYMFAKIHNYVCFHLPTMMENIQKTHIERQQRIAELTVEQEGFIERFLNTHRYFYVPTTETFVFYDGQRYTITTEDSILYHILTTITREKQLMIWKQRTKVYLMKRIKESLLSKSIPETETIQRVLSALHPALFETKQEAKYFLTILGDNLLRKRETDWIHFITPKAKAFLREITQISQLMFGVNAAITFKHKYYDHEYAHCRLVSINGSVSSEPVWGAILTDISIDMLCVACHYSMRYSSSDDYVARFSNQDTLESSVFYLRNHTRAQLVERFIGEYLEVSPSTQSVSATAPSSTAASPSTTPPTSTGFLNSAIQNAYATRPSRQISWKNMQYLWRHFLDLQKLPAVMFQQDLKTGLVDALSDHYREDLDVFIGVSSRYMPAIRNFLSFWENTMVYEESGEYEIEEMCVLYKKWLAIQPLPTPSGPVSLNEKQMLDLIAYYFPYVEIEKDKYIYGVRCSLWDKQLDIQTAMEQMKEMLRESTDADATANYATTIYDAYIWYCRYYSNTGVKPVEKPQIASKAYFDKYVAENIGIYIIDDKYLSVEWLYR